jgi:hypothetical protein
MSETVWDDNTNKRPKDHIEMLHVNSNLAHHWTNVAQHSGRGERAFFSPFAKQ